MFKSYLFYWTIMNIPGLDDNIEDVIGKKCQNVVFFFNKM